MIGQAIFFCNLVSPFFDAIHIYMIWPIINLPRKFPTIHIHMQTVSPCLVRLCIVRIWNSAVVKSTPDFHSA